VTDKWFKKCCISNETNGKEDEEVRNLNSEQESVSTECETENGSCEDADRY
jgi:hypothetical protein